MILAKHFPLGDHFINFHSFFSWLHRSRPCKGITVLDSKFKTRGFRIPGTGFRILIVSGLQIPRVVFRSPKPRILDFMGKNFLDSRFHEQKLPGFRGRILYNGAIGENWCWSLLRLNGLKRKPKLNRLCYNSAKTFGIWNISSKEPGETRYADGVWEPKNHLAMSNRETKEKFSQPRLCDALLDKLRQVEEWADSMSTIGAFAAYWTMDSINKAVNLVRNWAWLIKWRSPLTKAKEKYF